MARRPAPKWWAVMRTIPLSDLIIATAYAIAATITAGGAILIWGG